MAFFTPKTGKVERIVNLAIDQMYSDSMIPDTNVDGNIATINEVSDDQKRRSFTPEFKQEAASLMLDQDYTISQDCTSLGVGESALRRWVQ